MKKYTGGCHCEKVRFEVELDLETAQVMECNCSYCKKVGWLMTFAPGAQFKLLSGESDLTEYLFNTQKIHHLFCSTCGLESFAKGADADGNEVICINVRCLDDVQFDTLTITQVNGKDF